MFWITRTVAGAYLLHLNYTSYNSTNPKTAGRNHKLAWGPEVLSEKSIDELQPQKLEKITHFLSELIGNF